MSLTEIICQIHVQQSENDHGDHGNVHKTVLLPLSECHDAGIETRKKWAIGVMEHVGERIEHISIRPWDFVALLDGSVESLATPTSEDGLSEGYPACFQIPHGTLHGLETNEKVERAEKFAMASLLYEIMTSSKPFEGLSDGEVQKRFTKGDFPDDAATLPLSLFILSGWSKEFSQEVARTMKPHNKARLILTGVTALGLTVGATALLAIPILGAVGFAAAGPVAGSIAAGWQASIGVVQAGSLFAWCQGAAMGGAAVGGIQAAGVAGFAGAAMGGAAVGGIQAAGVADMQETFRRVYRTPERALGL